MLRYKREAYVLTRVSPPQDRWSILLMRKVGSKFQLEEIVYDGIGKEHAIELFEELTNKECGSL